MTRLITTGFETGDLSDIYNYNTAPTIQTSPTPRAGTYILRPTQNDCWASLRTFGATDTLYIGAAWRRNFVGSTTARILQILDGSANVLGEVGITSGNNFYISDGVTTLDTNTLFIPAVDTWYYIEIYFYCADSGGRFVVKLNEGIIIDFTGDTKRLSSYQAQEIRLWSGPGTATYNYWDDVVVNDHQGSVNNTYPGDIVLEAIRPNAAGDVTGLTRGGTDSGANWSQVEEVPVNTADYVADTVVDDYDLYNTGTVTLPAGSVIRNVIVVSSALLDSGSGNLANMIKSGGTESTGSTQALGVALRNYEEVWAVNPADSQPFEQADIDALQIGVKVK